MTVPMYPQWQIPYEVVVAENDSQKRLQNLLNAETAIVERMQQLNGSEDHHEERQALQEAVDKLRIIKADRFNYPNWKDK